jgi:hypothetical protein
MGGIIRLTQQVNEGRAYMLVAILQELLQSVLKLSVIFGLAFMVACTALMIVCLVRGDIRINIVRGSAEKESK